MAKQLTHIDDLPVTSPEPPAPQVCTVDTIMNFIGPDRGGCRVMLDLPNDGTLHAVNSLQMRMDVNGDFLVVLSAKSIRQ